MSEDKSILLYNGEGASSVSVKQTLISLKQVSSIPIRTIDHTHLMQEEWEKNCALLVFPGGRDLPYHHKLQGEPNKRIYNYVSNGGRYLGLCAGAYFASAEVEFEKGGVLEILGKRELAFFPGKTVGPALGLNRFQYHSESGSANGKIRFNNEFYYVYYNGGCYFDNAAKAPKTQILATYDTLPEKPAAIVLCDVGQGKALLSGLHPEFPLKRGDKKRFSLWKDLILLIINKN